MSPTGPDGDAVRPEQFVAEAFLVQDTGIQDAAGKEIIHVFDGMDVLFVAEVFLTQDTGIKDAAGKAVVKVFGGLEYGWQVRGLSSSRR